MDRDELKRIVEQQGWQDACFLDETSIRADAVVLEARGPEWAVHLTTERAGEVPTTLRTFACEAAALEYMLHKLRQSAKVRELSLAVEWVLLNPQPHRLGDVAHTW